MHELRPRKGRAVMEEEDIGQLFFGKPRFFGAKKNVAACDRCKRTHKRCDRYYPCSECILAGEGSCDRTDEIGVGDFV